MMCPVSDQATRSILRDPRFGRLWFIQASTQIGGNMALYALTILVFATTRSNAAVSALVMSFLIPTILLSALAGVLVDRLDVRWALIVPNTIRMFLTFGLAVAGANVAVLLLLNLGISLTTVVLTPAEASMIPRIVPTSQLETAMGIFNLTLQASFAAGFALLGPLLVTLTASPSLVLAVVTAFYAGATVATFGLPAAPPVARPGSAGRRSFHEPLEQLTEGLAAIHGNREVGRPLLHLAASASLVGVLGVLGPSLASSIGLDPKDLVVVVLPLGIGVVAGVFGLRRFGQGLTRRRTGEAGLFGFGALALAIAAIAAGAIAGPPVIPIVVTLAFLAGAAYATTTVSAQTALFENMAAGVRGRVFGVLASIVSAASLLPILVAGPLADQTSGAFVIALSAAAVLVAAIVSARLFGPRTASRAGARAGSG